MGYDQKIATELLKCKGCSQLKWCDINGISSNYIFLCPCRLCYLKMICEDTCPEYNSNIATSYTDKQFTDAMKEAGREMRVARKPNILRERYHE